MIRRKSENIFGVIPQEVDRELRFANHSMLKILKIMFWSLSASRTSFVRNNVSSWSSSVIFVYISSLKRLFMSNLSMVFLLQGRFSHHNRSFLQYLTSLVSVVVFFDGKDSILVILIESSNVMKEKNYLGSIDGFWWNNGIFPYLQEQMSPDFEYSVRVTYFVELYFMTS